MTMLSPDLSSEELNTGYWRSALTQARLAARLSRRLARRNAGYGLSARCRAAWSDRRRARARTCARKERREAWSRPLPAVRAAPVAAREPQRSAPGLTQAPPPLWGEKASAPRLLFRLRLRLSHRAPGSVCPWPPCRRP